MTKLRAPLSFELALAKIAGHIGWPAVANIVGRRERAVRAWGDPDAVACIRLDAALKLDLAWHAAGGEGAPMLDCFSRRFAAEAEAADPDSAALARATACLAKENGEAVAALVEATRPGATDFERERALREVEESIQAASSTLPILRAGRTTAGRTGEPL